MALSRFRVTKRDFVQSDRSIQESGSIASDGATNDEWTQDRCWRDTSETEPGALLCSAVVSYFVYIYSM